MILVVGLGNPGKKFHKTRHNVGFQILDEFRKTKNFPEFRPSKKFLAEISEGFLGEEKIILAKPQTFMNSSGKSVKSIIKTIVSGFPPIRCNSAMAELQRMGNNFDYLWVIHDDIDLPLGKIKIVKNRGPAGHKGVRSIIDEIGTKNFIRLRVGIKPERMGNNEQKADVFVLNKFSKKEEEIVKGVVKRTVEAMEFTLRKGLEKAMEEHNKSPEK